MTPIRSRLIVADPPWLERGSGKVKRGADRHYDLLDVPGIIEVMLRSTFADGAPVWNPDPSGCHVWLWVTGNRLVDGIRILDALGVRYINQRAWVKARPASDASVDALHRESLRMRGEVSTRTSSDQIHRDILSGLVTLERFGLGQYLRGAHELALFGVVGSRPSEDKTIPSVLHAPRGPHSKKPDVFFEDCARIAGAGVQPGERVEIFGRGPREGWSVFGAESEGAGSPGARFLAQWHRWQESEEWLLKDILGHADFYECKANPTAFVQRRSAANLVELTGALDFARTAHEGGDHELVE